MDRKEIILNNNQKEICLSNIEILNRNLLSLYQSVHNCKIDESSRNLSAQVIEYKLYELFKTLGYNGNLVTGIESRFEEIRNANLKIKELEEQLKNKHNEIDIQEEIVTIIKTLVKWWGIDGFRSVDDIKFNNNGYLDVKFTFYISDFCNIYSDKSDISVKENWLEQLKKRNFKLLTNEFNIAQTILIDCSENRELLKTLIKTKLPSAKITNWNSTLFLEKEDEDIFEIQSINLIIKDISDIKKLEPYVEKFKQINIYV